LMTSSCPVVELGGPTGSTGMRTTVPLVAGVRDAAGRVLHGQREVGDCGQFAGIKAQ
jgi:hypothetical protein